MLYAFSYAAPLDRLPLAFHADAADAFAALPSPMIFFHCLLLLTLISDISMA